MLAGHTPADAQHTHRSPGGPRGWSWTCPATDSHLCDSLSPVCPPRDPGDFLHIPNISTFRHPTFDLRASAQAHADVSSLERRCTADESGPAAFGSLTRILCNAEWPTRSPEEGARRPPEQGPGSQGPSGCSCHLCWTHLLSHLKRPTQDHRGVSCRPPARLRAPSLSM